jgi:hypothetical protein
MSVVFHVTLLNILGFVHLPEKVLDKYFEIKGVLNLITCSWNIEEWVIKHIPLILIKY